MNGTGNPYAAIGLPPTWQPAPVTFAVAHLQGMAVTAWQSWHVLRIDTPYGVQAFAFDDAAARTLVDALTKQLTGIDVVRALPPNTNGKADRKSVV